MREDSRKDNLDDSECESRLREKNVLVAVKDEYDRRIREKEREESRLEVENTHVIERTGENCISHKPKRAMGIRYWVFIF